MEKPLASPDFPVNVEVEKMPDDLKEGDQKIELVERSIQKENLAKLPAEPQIQIFDYLGPATKRFLGATCKSFYDIWKGSYFEQTIRVHLDEYLHHGPRTFWKSRNPYDKIFTSWLWTNNSVRMSRELTGIEMLWAHENLRVAIKAHERTSDTSTVGLDLVDRNLTYGNILVEYRVVAGDIFVPSTPAPGN